VIASRLMLVSMEMGPGYQDVWSQVKASKIC